MLSTSVNAFVSHRADRQNERMTECSDHRTPPALAEYLRSSDHVIGGNYGLLMLIYLFFLEAKSRKRCTVAFTATGAIQ